MKTQGLFTIQLEVIELLEVTLGIFDSLETIKLSHVIKEILRQKWWRNRFLSEYEGLLW